VIPNDSRKYALPEIGESFPSCACLPTLKAVVDEVENNVQAPRPLVFFAALSALAIAVQGLCDVRKPIGQSVPVSLMLLSIADSGERKSTAENIFFEPIRKFQQIKEAADERSLKEWKAKVKIWDAKNRVIIRQIEKHVHEDTCSNDAERRLIEHELTRPIKPKQFKMLYEDSTSEALFQGLYENFPSAGLVSSEGGGILNGRPLTDLSKHNAIWSGDSVTVDRKTVASYKVVGARLTVSMMVQRSAFDEYMKKAGMKSRGSGLWARFLVCCPRSTQGTRFIKNETISWEHRDKFHERMSEILKLNSVLLETQYLEREIIGFSPEASEMWLGIYNSIESRIKDRGRFDQMGDHASKLADNISRVAALLHYFEGFEGDISCSTLKFSLEICLWCSDEFYYLFLPTSQEDQDAIELKEWLSDIWSEGDRWVSKNYIRQYGPNKIRDKIRLNKALKKLEEKGEINLFFRARTQCVEPGSPLIVRLTRNII